jgi:hypothetical protein
MMEQNGQVKQRKRGKEKKKKKEEKKAATRSYIFYMHKKTHRKAE